MTTNGTSGVIASPNDTDVHDDSSGEEDLKEEQDSNSAENDDRLLTGRSPEFDHLQRRAGPEK